MIFLKLALKSLRNRMFSSVLTVISIALSVALLLSVDRVKRAAEEGFTQAISKTDLIVGARSGSLQLILYTVFNMGNATHNISYDTYQKVRENPAIDWTIPYSLGDSHKGYRVVGTNSDFFKHYHYRGNRTVDLARGNEFSSLWDVVIGSEVARKLRYSVGERIVLTHGVTRGEGFQHHDDRPFTVTGILEPTGTALDRAVYISLEGMEALHMDWQSGQFKNAGDVKDVKVETITAFFVGAKSRIETLSLQRAINNFKDEPLLAIIPGVALSELWHGLSYVEGTLKAISWMVVIVGLVGMLIALTSTLNERRREMAILRALGATATQISGLLVFESCLLTLSGIVLGVVITGLLTLVLSPWLITTFGIYIAGKFFSSTMWIYIAATLTGGILIGFIPAIRARTTALKDGLSVRQ